MMVDSMLTTVDNPYDPFDDYENWYAFDSQMGYHSPSLLARVTLNSDELSEVDQSLAIETAIEIIVKENVSGMHTRVQRESTDVSID